MILLLALSLAELWIAKGWLKAPWRAAEKAVICYRGDVSRVVDICRRVDQ